MEWNILYARMFYMMLLHDVITEKDKKTLELFKIKLWIILNAPNSTGIISMSGAESLNQSWKSWLYEPLLLHQVCEIYGFRGKDRQND